MAATDASTIAAKHLTDVKKQAPTADAALQARRTLQATERLLAAKVAHDDLIEFAQLMTPDPDAPDDVSASLYKPAAVHRMIAEALQEVEAGRCLRLLISCPPQHGKSQLTSRFCPAWLIGRSPWKNLMLGSYNQDFANEFGDDVRNIMDTPAYKLVFQKSGLRIGSRAKDHMVTTRGGKLSFLGRGGAGTGRPADFFFVDDPIKDAKEAESPTIRNDVWQWFTKVAFTRCHAASAIVVIQTRWSEDDLIGRLTDPNNPCYDAEEAAKWTYINIPAIFTDPRDEPIAKALGIEMGQPLWPERFTIEHLASAKRLNPTGFSALYMGRPTPPEGSFYKADMLIGYSSMAELPRNMMMYGSGDLAVTPDKDSDMTCVGNWGIDSNSDLWLLPDLYWERKAADQVVDQLIDFAAAHKWMTFAVEKGPIDRAVGPFLQRRMRERGHYFHVEKFPTIGNKAGRSLSIRGRMAQGRVHFPTFARWWPAAKEQLLKFTGTGADREDDFADMLAMIGQLMDVVMAGSKPVEKTDEKVVCIGTLRWIKMMDEHKRRQDRRHKALAGM